MRISIELVPRNETDLRAQLAEVESLPRVDTVNIPDISRFELRSWQSCGAARESVDRVIPHLRAIDVDLERPVAAARELECGGVEEALVVAGDVPADMSRRVYATSTLDLIRKLRREHPSLALYAAFDPYRQGMLAERTYADQKLEAGAIGLFTQPFFDVRLMEVYAEQLAGIEVFWGVTSVLSMRSRRYWQTRNRAVFPAGFQPTLEWNRRLAKDALTFVETHGGNIYFMPIRAGIGEYLHGIL
ncbi:MAG TPA: methylenetetrahydrofolate reductase [Trueperaceae bacterium]